MYHLFLRLPGALLTVSLLLIFSACAASTEGTTSALTSAQADGVTDTLSSDGPQDTGSSADPESGGDPEGTSSTSASAGSTNNSAQTTMADDADSTTTTAGSSPDTTAPSGATSTTATSGTTSTTSPSTPAAGMIGVVGCSNTAQAVNGYIELSSIDKLTPGDLGGGSVPAWGDTSDGRYRNYWGRYDDRRPADGYAAAWVQLCLRVEEHDGAFDGPEQAWVSHIVDQIQARDPGITIWMSPLNFYEGFVCDRTGPDGPAISAEASDWAASQFSSVQRGPDLGPLQLEHIASDLCHPNYAGTLLMGGQLVEFFD